MEEVIQIAFLYSLRRLDLSLLELKTLLLKSFLHEFLQEFASYQIELNDILKWTRLEY